MPLSAAAIELLRQLKQGSDRPVRLPGANGKPLTEIKRTWLAVCRTAALAECVPKKIRNGKVVYGKDGAPVMVWRQRRGFTIFDIHTPAFSPLMVYRCPSSALCLATHSRRRLHGTLICWMIRYRQRPSEWAR